MKCPTGPRHPAPSWVCQLSARAACAAPMPRRPRVGRCSFATDSAGLLQPQGVATRNPSRRKSSALPAVLERVRVPPQPALLPNREVQQRPRDRDRRGGANVPAAVRREVKVPQAIGPMGASRITMGETPGWRTRGCSPTCCHTWSRQDQQVSKSALTSRLKLGTVSTEFHS